MNLLGKGAIEIAPPAQSESGFYSRYFLVPKKTYSRSQTPEIRPDVKLFHDIYIYIYAFSRRFYPKRLTLHSSYSFYILSALAFPGNRTHDLGVANAMLYQLSYRKAVMKITLKQIIPQICPGDWFVSLDLKDAYFQIQVAPHNRQFLRFTFKGVAYQYKVLPFGLSLAPRTFTRCGSLRSATDGNPHTQLPRRLAHSGPVAGGFNIVQDPPPQPLRLPGAQGQVCQEHTVTQPTV